MKRSTGRIRWFWDGLTGAERGVLALVALILLATGVLAAVGIAKRPADISNPDVAFETGTLAAEKKEPPKDRTVEWPRFGFDLARTKFLNAQQVRPPYRKLWRYDQHQLIEFAPILAKGHLYMIDNDAVFVSLDSKTGKVAWKKQLGTLNASSPAYWRGMLLAVNLEPGQALGLRARDGKVLWRRDLGARSESSPLVVGRRMYFGDEGGEFHALDARTGKVVWTTELEGSVKAAPAFANGTLYVGDYAGKMYAIRAKDGAIRWQADDLGSGLGQSGRFYSTPAVAFGRVYAGNADGRVYSFDRNDGTTAWTHSAGGYVYSGVAAAETAGTKPAVYFGSHDGFVYSLDARTGDVNWQVSPGGQVSGPATVVGDVVYFSTFSGNATLGFDLGTGRRVFKFDSGQYGPVISDGQVLYMVGGSEVIAYEPVDAPSYKAAPGTKGIVPPAEWRRIQAKRRERAGGGQGAGSASASAGRPARGGGGSAKG